MRRAVPLTLALVVLAVGCTASPAGPTRPDAPDQVTPDDAVKATGARAAAFAFVEAYAESTGPDVSALEGLVGTRRLRRWVHWLGVQNREFPGTIAGSVAGEEVGPAAPFSVSTVPGAESILRQVDVRATVRFRFEPRGGDPISVDRSLDGPMRLVLDPVDGSWKVLDLTRDGVPLSAAFATVKGGRATGVGVQVTIEAFLSEPYWEFFITAEGVRPFGFVTAGTALEPADGSVVQVRAITPSLRHVAPGTRAEGIITFPPQPAAEGTTLRLRLATTTGSATFRFPLGALIDPLPIAAPTPSASPGA